MDDNTMSSPDAKKRRLSHTQGPDYIETSLKKENETLKREVAQLRGRVSQLEKELGKEAIVWELCPDHQRNTKAIDCSNLRDEKSCPLQPPTPSFQDLTPEFVGTIFKYLDRKSALACRLVCKTWKSHLKLDLHMAVDTGDLEAVEALVEEGVNVNQKLYLNGKGCLSQGFTPLHWASASSTPEHIDIGELLIESGANVNMKNGLHCTPLHSAAESSSHYSGDFIHMLLKARADTEAKSRSGRTPIFSAASNNSDQSIENLEMLIDGGADIHATDNGGNTPMHAMLDVDIWFRAKIAKGKFKILLQAGADPNAKDNQGNTVLHLLVDEIKREGNRGRLQHITPHLELVTMLVEAGADKLIKNRNRQTPLEHAKRYKITFACEDAVKALERVKEHLGI